MKLAIAASYITGLSRAHCYVFGESVISSGSNTLIDKKRLSVKILKHSLRLSAPLRLIPLSFSRTDINGHLPGAVKLNLYSNALTHEDQAEIAAPALMNVG